MRFEGRVAVVTGGTGGVGAAIAARLAREGAMVVALDIKAHSNVSHAPVHRAAGRVQTVPCDIENGDDVADAMDRTVADHGRLDVLVNSAITPPATAFSTMTLNEWDRDVAIALRAPLLCIRGALRHMAANPDGGGGVIVNIASVNALGFFGHDAYSAGKAGLISLTRSIAARHGADGVRANAVVPGTVATARWHRRLRKDPTIAERVASWYPIGRVGEPDDVAAAVAYLASDDASWVTGAVLNVDGGMSVGMPAMVRDMSLEADAAQNMTLPQASQLNEI